MAVLDRLLEIEEVMRSVDSGEMPIDTDWALNKVREMTKLIYVADAEAYERGWKASRAVLEMERGTAPNVEKQTCPKCGMVGIAFICSEPGCPVNGGAAH